MAGTVPLKQVVNMTLTTETLRRARALVGPRNLSSTVDTLLAELVARADVERASHRTEIARWIAASNAVIAEHGSPADEYDLA